MKKIEVTSGMLLTLTVFDKDGKGIYLFRPTGDLNFQEQKLAIE